MAQAVNDIRVNIPPITSIITALNIYYTYTEIGNKEIELLFGKRSKATVIKLKKLVIDEMIKRNRRNYSIHKVNTEIAFEVWGIDVVDLEYRLKKLNSLKALT